MNNNNTIKNTIKSSALGIFLMSASFYSQSAHAAWTCTGDSFNTGLVNWEVSGTYTPNIVTVGGQKRLRLTDASGNKSSFAQYKRWYPGAGNKVQIEFNYHVYGGNGADGMVVVLSDANTPAAAGGYGGSMGYAQYSGGFNGFNGGWLGIGIDEYGNFKNATENRLGYPSSYTPPTDANITSGGGLHPNSISVRGSGTGQTGYYLLANTGDITTHSPAKPAIWTNSSKSSSSQKFRITVDHSNNVNAYLKVERDTGSGYKILINNTDVKKANSRQSAVPENWLVSFTSGTGGQNNNHEISMLNICADYSIPVPTGGANQFNVIDPSALTTWSSTARKPLLTKMSGTNFTLDVGALKADGSLEGGVVPSGGSPRTVSVELFDYDNTKTCSAYTSPITSQNVTFTSGTYHYQPGRVTSGNFNVATAHKEVIARVTDSNGASPVVSCSTDTFTIRPQSLSMSSTTANADNSGLSNTTALKIKTGDPFTINTLASALKYNGIPKIDNSKIEWLNKPADGRTVAERGVGNLTGNFTSTVSATGISTGTFDYDEVGYFRFQPQGLYDDTFVSKDKADGDCNIGFGNTLVSNEYGCSFGNLTATNHLGRFIPSGYALNLSSIINRSNESGGILSSFTYLGETLTNNIVLNAVNHNGVITKNYSGVRFDGNVANNYGLKASVSSGSVNLTPLISNLTSTGSWSGGQLTTSLVFNVSKGSTPSNPYLTRLSINPIDLDNVGMTSFDIDSDFNGSNESKLTGNTNLYYGVLKIHNVSGSDLTKSATKVEVQYYNGFGFVVNSSDNLTSLNASRFTTTNFTNNLQSSEVSFIYPTANFVSGVQSITVNKPTGGDGLYNGSFKLGYDLIGDNKAYLRGNWTGATADYTENPNAVISLSRAKAKKGMIFIMENY